MKNSKIFALATFVALLFGALPINAQTQRVGSLIESGKTPSTSIGKSVSEKFSGVSSKFADRMKQRKASADGTQGTPPPCIDRTVINLNNDGEGSLRWAILNAGNTCTVTIAVKGTVFLTESIEIGEKALKIVLDETIFTAPGEDSDFSSDEFIVDGSGITDSSYGSVFDLVLASVEMTGFTITGGKGRGGKGTFGGGIYLEDSLLFMNYMTVRGNSADFGGGISVNYSTLFLNLSTVSGNTANQDGGGIYFEDFVEGLNFVNGFEDLIVSTSTIADNTATRGGWNLCNGHNP